jgi:bacillithiol system protein YtxJ
MHWSHLSVHESPEDWEKRFTDKPVLIYKHSSRCELCQATLVRIEQDWDFTTEDLDAYFVDVIGEKMLSQRIAEYFSVAHESPQVLLIKKGSCVYEADHLEIDLQELREQLEDESWI